MLLFSSCRVSILRSEPEHFFEILLLLSSLSQMWILGSVTQDSGDTGAPRYSQVSKAPKKQDFLMRPCS